jgi:hypothetical protein
MATTAASIVSPPISLPWLKGRFIGALICAGFGAVWMFEALFFGAIATPLSLTSIAMLTVAFVAWPVIRLRSLPAFVYSAADRERWAAISVPYWTNAAIEWLLCFGAAGWLAHIHQYMLIPQCLGAIIGLHFLPLARMFRSPVYYLTGAVMVLGVLASLAIPAGHIRTIVACGVDGLSLWATAATILCRDWLSSREEETGKVIA